MFRLDGVLSEECVVEEGRVILPATDHMLLQPLEETSY